MILKLKNVSHVKCFAVVYLSCTFLLSLHEKCQYSELFWSVFSRIRAEYLEPYSVQVRKNTDTFYSVFLLLEHQFSSITRMESDDFYIQISYVCIFSVQEEGLYFSSDNHVFVWSGDFFSFLKDIWLTWNLLDFCYSSLQSGSRNMIFLLIHVGNALRFSQFFYEHS